MAREARFRLPLHQEIGSVAATATTSLPCAPARCVRTRIAGRNAIQPASTSDRPQFPETSLSPITPARMRTMQSILSGAAESPSTTIPRIAVPAAPMPVQTA
jgi:hypothetical protein